jgi:signal transduction histidine kinase
MRTQFQRRLTLLLQTGALVGISAACLTLLILAITGVGLLVVWVGLPMLLATVLAGRPVAGVGRRIAGQILGQSIETPYLRPAGGNLFLRLRGYAKDPATWRDALWLLINGIAGLALTIAGLVECVLDLVFWWLPPGMLVRADAHITRALLAPNEKTLLARRVQELTDSRAETVDTSAAELRRIERDLHDGAQARLVALAMSLGLAESELERNPESARQLLAEARVASSVALTELRDLVRGIHPPVLADRGLVGAVHALALATPLPVELVSDVPERLPAAVESAAYFAVAEALTNVIKHSGARHVWIDLAHADGLVRAEVRDDGVGGADVSRGTGIRGIERRLSAFDGTVTVESPAGGPTNLVMVLPCASSSPKTSPSSGTA